MARGGCSLTVRADLLDLTVPSSRDTHQALQGSWGALYASWPFRGLYRGRAPHNHQPVPTLGPPTASPTCTWVPSPSGPGRAPALSRDRHVDTHLFFSSSPASPLERQQKQVNRGTCQTHARYVDGKREQARKEGYHSRDRDGDGVPGGWGTLAEESESKATRDPPHLQAFPASTSPSRAENSV